MPIRCRVEHLGLPAIDPVQLAEWYVLRLGAQRLWDNGSTPPAVFVRLHGGLILEIYPAASRIPDTGLNSTAGFRHLALRVDNLDQARDGLLADGIETSEPVRPAGGGGRVLFFQDPEGNLLHLVERPSDAPLHLI